MDDIQVITGRVNDSSFIAQMVSADEWHFVVTDIPIGRTHWFKCDHEQAGIIIALAISGGFEKFEQRFPQFSGITDIFYVCANKDMPRDFDGDWIVDGTRLIP
jgi:hypothetical protein